MRKACITCGVEKDLAEFSTWWRKKIQRREISGVCRSCMRTTKRAYARKKRAELRGRFKTSHDVNRERERRAAERKRQHSTLERYLVLCARRKRNDCHKRREPCDFTDFCLIAQYEKQGGTCALTGRPLKWKVRGGPDTLSIDRIDPRRGYTMENIRLVTLQANIARWTARDRELIALAADVMRCTARSRFGDGSVDSRRKPTPAEVFVQIVSLLKEAGVKITLERSDGPADEVRVALKGRSKKSE